MSLAIFSDVHGNLPALRAVLDDIRRQGCRSVFCLGDLVDYGPFPNEVVETIRERDIPTIIGNHDEGIAFELAGSGGGYRDLAEKAFKEAAFVWTAGEVKPEHRTWLRQLPRSLRLEAGGHRFLLVHASPERLNEYLFEDTPEARFREIAAGAEADVVVFGHTHRPYVKVVDGVTFINVGSVGNPKDGDPRAFYAIVRATPTKVEVEPRRVDYDIESLVEALHQRGLPEIYAQRVRTGT